MKLFLSELLNPGEIHFGIIAALLYMLPLKRKKLFLIRFCTAGLPLMLAGTGIVLLRRALIRKLEWGYLWNIPTEIVLFGIMTPLIIITLLAGVFRFCCNIQWIDALYGAFCADLTQHLAYTVFELFFPYASHRASRPLLPQTLWIECLSAAVIFGLTYFLLAKRLPQNGKYPLSCIRLLPTLLLIFLTGRAIGIITEHAYILKNSYFFQFIQLYDILLVSTLLTTQLLQRKKSDLEESIAVNRQIQQMQEREYQLFRRNTETLNHNFHDLRHLLNALKFESSNTTPEELLALNAQIDIYDCAINSGSRELDALLVDALLRCQKSTIQWTCVADGSAVKHISPVDLYVMLGNALDNAIESASEDPDALKRFLCISIWRRAQFAFIKIENNCPHSITFEDNLPQTTKSSSEFHGYGTKSIRDICRKYEGEYTMSAQNAVFTLDLVFPIPQRD